jgi:hypothetical protein
MSKISDHLYL